MRQGVDDRTSLQYAFPGTAGDKPVEGLADAAQPCDLPLNLVFLGKRPRAYLRAIAFGVGPELEETAYLAKRKTELLGLLDETDLCDLSLRILPERPVGSRRLNDEALALVKANGFHADAGAIRRFANGE